MLLCNTVASQARRHASSSLETKLQKFEVYLLEAMGETTQITMDLAVNRAGYENQPKNYRKNADCREQELKHGGTSAHMLPRTTCWPIVRTSK